MKLKKMLRIKKQNFLNYHKKDTFRGFEKGFKTIF